MGARTTSKSIRELLDHIDANELVLPEIQREFVWSKKSVKLLFDSLYRQMPIGHMLVWKATRPVQVKHFAHKRTGRTALHERFYGYLLDGQQRLTAISLVKNNDDGYRLLFNLSQEPEDDADLFYWAGRWAEGDPWLVPLTDVLSKDFRTLEYLKSLKADESWKDTYEQPVHDMLERVKSLLDYSVGITEYESASYNDATQLFIRFNGTGRKLNKSDLAVAELAQRVPGLVSNDLSKALVKWQPHFRFTRPFLVQCLAAVRTQRMSWKQPEVLWKGHSPAELKNSWRSTERALGEVLKLLTGTVRWDSSSWVPSFNALIPLVVICTQSGPPNPDERELARKWLLLTGVHSFFSGSVYTELDRLLRRLTDKPGIRTLWKVTKKKLRRLRPDDFQTGRMNGPVMSLYISMLRNGHARDWKDHTPLDGTVLGHNAKLQVHHFFPQALLHKHEWEPTSINTFANYVVLSAATNLNISTEEPATYLGRAKLSSKDLDDQCIPSDEKLWRVDRYEDFLEAREKLLSERANKFLRM